MKISLKSAKLALTRVVAQLFCAVFNRRHRIIDDHCICDLCSTLHFIYPNTCLCKPSFPCLPIRSIARGFSTYTPQTTNSKANFLLNDSPNQTNSVLNVRRHSLLLSHDPSLTKNRVTHLFQTALRQKASICEWTLHGILPPIRRRHDEWNCLY